METGYRRFGWSCELRGSGKAHTFAQNANEWGTRQKRFYDFNVWSERKRIEKLRYMHRNPVKRGLVEEPDQWKWSSFRAHFYGERGIVRVNYQEWPLEIKPRPGGEVWRRNEFGSPQSGCSETTVKLDWSVL